MAKAGHNEKGERGFEVGKCGRRESGGTLAISLRPTRCRCPSYGPVIFMLHKAHVLGMNQDWVRVGKSVLGPPNAGCPKDSPNTDGYSSWHFQAMSICREKETAQHMKFQDLPGQLDIVAHTSLPLRATIERSPLVATAVLS